MITILGATGYVGKAFTRAAAKAGLAHETVSRSTLDYTDGRVLSQYLAERKPQFLINCAGYTGKPNVDACEGDKAATLAGNAVLPGTIRAACLKAGVPWGHVSSGCIFSGRRKDGNGFTEDDAPNFSFRQGPCSWYSGTKALGEEVLGYGTTDGSKWQHEDSPDCFIWRLRIPFDEVDSPRNYLSKLINYSMLLEAENSISHLDEFVEGCLSCWLQRVPFGIYNIVNPGSTSTRRVAQLIAKSGVSSKSFSFFDSDDDFYRLAAKTPRSNCVLDGSKLASVGIKLRPVEDAIKHALRNWTQVSPNSANSS